MFNISLMQPILPLPDCSVCGVKAGDDHVKDCNWLTVLRADAYPHVLDDNGMRWEYNYMRKLEAENAELRAKINVTSGD